MYGEEAVGGCHGAVVSHGNVRRLCRGETSVPARTGRRRRRLRSEVILARLGLRRGCGAIPHSSSADASGLLATHGARSTAGDNSALNSRHGAVMPMEEGRTIATPVG